MSKEITCGSHTGVASTQGLLWWQEGVVSGSHLEKTPMAPCGPAIHQATGSGLCITPKRKGNHEKENVSYKGFPRLTSLFLY